MRTVGVVFENGVFRPTKPVNLPSGSAFDIVVPDMEPDPVADLQARYPTSFGGFDPEEASRITKAIEDEFERVDPNAWE